MRLIPFLILAYVAIGMQLGLGSLLAFGGSPPNFVLLAVIFIAVQAPREPALLGCFALGLIHDLVSQHPLGLHALAYGLSAILIVSAQSAFQRDNPLAHVLLALASGIIVMVVILLNQRFKPAVAVAAAEAENALPPIGMRAGALIWGVIWTTILAPVVLWPLSHLRRPFGFDRWR